MGYTEEYSDKLIEDLKKIVSEQSKKCRIKGNVNVENVLKFINKQTKYTIKDKTFMVFTFSYHCIPDEVVLTKGD